MIEISVKSGHVEKQHSACLVIGVYEGRRFTESGKLLNKATEGYLSALLRRGDIEGKIGQTLLLQKVSGFVAERLLLVGCGKEREVGHAQYRSILFHSVRTLNEIGVIEACSYLTELNIKGRDIAWKIRFAVEVTWDALYRFDKLKSNKNQSYKSLKKLLFSTQRKNLLVAEQAVREGIAIAGGVKIAKNLANLPGNICTPTYLAEYAYSLCTLYPAMRCQILDLQAMRDLGMNALLAVAQGSAEPAKLVELHYQGADMAPIVLVGKGITFDAGGISLKKPQDMDMMKFDMGGAAAVMGVMTAVAELQLPLHVIGLMPCTENLPSGQAVKPGDVITSLSGQTIEVLNTDAEGRLILCDTLTYAERFTPQAVMTERGSFLCGRNTRKI